MQVKASKKLTKARGLWFKYKIIESLFANMIKKQKGKLCEMDLPY
jgi:hypothetical protein